MNFELNLDFFAILHPFKETIKCQSLATSEGNLQWFSDTILIGSKIPNFGVTVNNAP